MIAEPAEVNVVLWAWQGAVIAGGLLLALAAWAESWG